MISLTLWYLVPLMLSLKSLRVMSLALNLVALIKPLSSSSKVLTGVISVVVATSRFPLAISLNRITLRIL
jgi:hypothetical protein